MDGRFFSGLTPHRPYTFEVTANNSGGESARSTLQVFWTDYDVPDQVLTFETVNYLRDDNSITLDWVAPVDNDLTITHYEIRYRCPTETVGYGCSHTPTDCPCNIAAAQTTTGLSLIHI